MMEAVMRIVRLVLARRKNEETTVALTVTSLNY